MSRFTFEMADPAHLGRVLRAVRDVEGVFDAYRVTSAQAASPAVTSSPPWTRARQRRG